MNVGIRRPRDDSLNDVMGLLHEITQADLLSSIRDSVRSEAIEARLYILISPTRMVLSSI